MHTHHCILTDASNRIHDRLFRSHVITYACIHVPSGSKLTESHCGKRYTKFESAIRRVQILINVRSLFKQWVRYRNGAIMIMAPCMFQIFQLSLDAMHLSGKFIS